MMLAVGIPLKIKWLSILAAMLLAEGTVDAKAGIPNMVLIHPLDQMVPFNEPYELLCTFVHETCCSWKRNNDMIKQGRGVDITPDSSSCREPSTRCTVRVSKAEPVGVLGWQCFVPGNSNSSTEVASGIATVTIVEKNEEHLKDSSSKTEGSDPLQLGIIGLSAVVGLALIIGGIVCYWKRKKSKSRTNTGNGKSLPQPAIVYQLPPPQPAAPPPQPQLSDVILENLLQLRRDLIPPPVNDDYPYLRVTNDPRNSLRNPNVNGRGCTLAPHRTAPGSEAVTRTGGPTSRITAKDPHKNTRSSTQSHIYDEIDNPTGDAGMNIGRFGQTSPFEPLTIIYSNEAS